jgi:crotonobetainyl-CoA:carnitine CoA-transferase CaiB-like acyl-CoA transferase
VRLSANGYGPDCASANRPSAHPVPGAVCGGALHQAGAATPPDRCESIDEVREVARQLMRANEANPDPNTSVVIASATLLALFARERYGVGQQVFVNMLVANAYANGDDFLRYEGKPPRPTVDGELYGTHALHRLYPARAGWVFVDAPEDDAWRRLCACLGRADLADDARFATAAARADHDAALVGVLSAALAERDASDWEAAAAGAGVGCVRADAAEPGAFWATDPHVLANGFAPEADHAALGRVRRWGPLSTVNGGADRYGPGVLGGQHTDAILRELGHDDAAIRGLRAAGVVWSEEAVRPESPAAG